MMVCRMFNTIETKINTPMYKTTDEYIIRYQLTYTEVLDSQGNYEIRDKNSDLIKLLIQLHNTVVTTATELPKWFYNKIALQIYLVTQTRTKWHCLCKIVEKKTQQTLYQLQFNIKPLNTNINKSVLIYNRKVFKLCIDRPLVKLPHDS